MSKDEAELQHKFSAFTESTTKLMTLPKKPLSGGEEISFGDLTVPPTLTEIWKAKRKPKKKYPYPTQRLTGGKFG